MSRWPRLKVRGKKIHATRNGRKLTTRNRRKLKAGQPLVVSEPAVGISYIKEYFRLWKEKNNKNACIETKGCRQNKTFIGEKQPIRWITVLPRLSRYEANALYNEVNYHRYKTWRIANLVGTSAYSPDLTPFDFNLFLNLKKYILSLQDRQRSIVLSYIEYLHGKWRDCLKNTRTKIV